MDGLISGKFEIVLVVSQMYGWMERMERWMDR